MKKITLLSTVIIFALLSIANSFAAAELPQPLAASPYSPQATTELENLIRNNNGSLSPENLQTKIPELFAQGADPDVDDGRLLAYAVANDNHPLALESLKAGANSNKISYHMGAPLLGVARSGSMVKLLLWGKANPDTKVPEGPYADVNRFVGMRPIELAHALHRPQDVIAALSLATNTNKQPRPN